MLATWGLNVSITDLNNNMGEDGKECSLKDAHWLVKKLREARTQVFEAEKRCAKMHRAAEILAEVLEKRCTNPPNESRYYWLAEAMACVEVEESW